MYTTRIIDDKEKDRYLHFIKKHPRGHFLQSFEWGEVQRLMGWNPLPLILEKDGEIQATLLILKKKLPFPFINKCIFYAPRGPVVDLESEELCQVLFAGANKVAGDHGAIFLKIEPDIDNFNLPLKETLRKYGFKKNETGLDLEGIHPSFAFRLDITPSEVRLMGNMDSVTRDNIRLAQHKGVRIREVSGKEELPRCYEILKEIVLSEQFLADGYKYFETIWEQMVQNGMSTFFVAEHEGQIISATVLIRLGDKAWYQYGASRQQDFVVKSHDLIQWEMIKWARKQGCTWYDFRVVAGDLDECKSLTELNSLGNRFHGVIAESVEKCDTVYSPFYYFLWNHLLPLYIKITRKNFK